MHTVIACVQYMVISVITGVYRVAEVDNSVIACDNAQ